MRNNLISVSIDDGHPLDLKAAEILAKKNIKTTFYIPIKNATGRPTLNKKQIKYLSQNPNFEIGGHTCNHVDLTKISLEKAEEEIRSGKEALEDIIGKKITTFAWPWGKYNKDLIGLAKKIGFLDCRSGAIINFKPINKKNLLWHPNLFVYPNSRMQDIRNAFKRGDIYSLILRLKYFNINHLDLVNLFQKINKPFHIWFHSWQIEELGLWPRIFF